MKISRELLSDAGRVASAQEVSVGHLVRVLLAREVARRLDPAEPGVAPGKTAADPNVIAAMKTLLGPCFKGADGWDDLAARMSAHGYEVRAAGGGIAVHLSHSGARICKGSDLGFAYRDLVRRFRAALPGHPQGTLGEVFAEAGPAGSTLDSTVKGRLQRALTPVFKLAGDWETLTARMQRRGYVFRPHGNGLAIYTVGGKFVCNTATVGYRYRALVKKFGAPMPGHPQGSKWVKDGAVISVHRVCTECAPGADAAGPVLKRRSTLHEGSGGSGPEEEFDVIDYDA